MSTGKHTPSMYDAFVFLIKVMITFHHENKKYNDFIYLLKDFTAERINVPSLRERVKRLFKGHEDLLVGLNCFLPKAYEITLPLEDEQTSQTEIGSINSRDKPDVSSEDAIPFVKKVRVTFFCENEAKYVHFLNIVNDFRTQRIELEDVAEKLKELFIGHNDLIVGFNVFLPKECEITLPLEDEQPPPQNEPVELAEDVTLMDKLKTWIIEGKNCDVNGPFLDTREVAECLEGHVDLLHEFTKLLKGSIEKGTRRRRKRRRRSFLGNSEVRFK